MTWGTLLDKRKCTDFYFVPKNTNKEPIPGNKFSTVNPNCSQLIDDALAYMINQM